MSTTTATEPSVSRSAAYRVLERIFDEGFATGNDAIVDEVCSPDLVEHQFGLAGRGADSIAQVKAAIRDVHRQPHRRVHSDAARPHRNPGR
jgi:hypothetical protein